MREKRRGSLLSLGLAAALAESEGQITETPPHRVF